MSVVMPRGTPLRSPASVVWLSSRSGLTKLITTRLTEGRPSPRSISQWFWLSNSATVRTLAQVQASLLQCQAPKTESGVIAAGIGAGAGRAAEALADGANARMTAASAVNRDLRDRNVRRIGTSRTREGLTT